MPCPLGAWSLKRLSELLAATSQAKDKVGFVSLEAPCHYIDPVVQTASALLSSFSRVCCLLSHFYTWRDHRCSHQGTVEPPGHPSKGHGCQLFLLENKLREGDCRRDSFPLATRPLLTQPRWVRYIRCPVYYPCTCGHECWAFPVLSVSPRPCTWLSCQRPFVRLSHEIYEKLTVSPFCEKNHTILIAGTEVFHLGEHIVQKNKAPEA